MNVDPNNLKRISTYAKMINKTPQWVHFLKKNNLISVVSIDGVQFVDVSKKSVSPKTV